MQLSTHVTGHLLLGHFPPGRPTSQKSPSRNSALLRLVFGTKVGSLKTRLVLGFTTVGSTFRVRVMVRVYG